MSRYFPTLQRGHPPSPPDTEAAVEPSILPDPKQRTETDVASPYSRRAPSIFYKQNEAAPPRDGSRGRPQHRWLVIVVPPPILELERADGSSRRTSAVMLPLFPTMYAQLVAIAREFNLPSTTGIRVHLHLPENSVGGAELITPRITDDVWPLLWVQYLSLGDTSTLLPGIPISGKIEFDLDLQQARWYNAWVRSHGPMSVAQVATSLPGKGASEDDGSVAQGSDNSVQRRRPMHMRQLSLLERRTTGRSVPFPITTGTQTGMEQEVSGGTADVVTTAAADVPANTLNRRDEVESLVQKWRANTPTVNPGIIHMSPEPSPRSLDLNDYSWSISSPGPLTRDPLASPTESDFSSVRSMHLADRAAGSVVLTPSTATSWGPPRSDFSHEGSLISNASRYPSPDIAARIMPEVPLTPSTATSWGPPDDDFDYDLLLMINDESSYPTPDIAFRAMDNIPVTPSTIASWGSPDDHIDDSGLFTELDIGEQTSDHGEGLSGPSPALAHQKLVIFSHVWPYTERIPSSRQHLMFPYVWPYTQVFVVHTPKPAAHVAFSENVSTSPPVPLPTPHPNSTMSYPNFDIYPHRGTLLNAPGAASIDIKLVRRYPNIEVYPAVYPFSLDCLYPSVYVDTSAFADANSAALVKGSSSQMYPFRWDYSHKSFIGKPPTEPVADASLQMYPFAWNYTCRPRVSLPQTLDTPSSMAESHSNAEAFSLTQSLHWDSLHHNHRSKDVVPSESTAVTSEMDSSSVVYPFLWDYTHRSSRVNISKTTPEVDMSSQVYPFTWDYDHQPWKAPPPTPTPSSTVQALVSEVESANIQSLGHPFRWDHRHIPLKLSQQSAEIISSRTPSVCTIFEGVDIASLVYPFGWDYIHHDVKKTPGSTNLGRSVSETDLSSQMYPFRWDYVHKSERGQRNADAIDWSSQVYPFSWDFTHKSSKQALIAGSSPRLPILIDGKDVMSLVYPFSWNYVHRPGTLVQLTHPTPTHAQLLSTYDGVDVASVAYPFSWNYGYRAVKRRESPKAPIGTKLPFGYPNLVVYVPVYPYNLDDIYPAITTDERSCTPRTNSNLKPQPASPVENPPGSSHIRSRTAFVNTSLDAEYPTLEIYCPVYPHNLDCIYPRVTSHARASNGTEKWEAADHVVVRLPSSYPFLRIYDHVNPSFEIHPDAYDVDVMGELPPPHFSNPVPPTNRRAVGLERFPQSVQEDEQYQEADDEGSMYRDERLSPMSFYSDVLEIDGAARYSRRSSAVALGGDDERLDEMDSPTRRFYLARQEDLRVSSEFSDGDEDADPFEFNAVPFPPITFSGRPSLSLNVHPEASTFFNDDNEDDAPSDSSQAHAGSLPGRFPRPSLSAVTEEPTPFSSVSARSTWSQSQ